SWIGHLDLTVDPRQPWAVPHRGTPEPVRGRGQQPPGDEGWAGTGVVAGDRLVESDDRHGQGLLPVEARRIPPDAVPQTGQQAGSDHPEGRGVILRDPHESAEDLVLALLSVRAELGTDVVKTPTDK